MQREILFRGRNIDTGEWVYGDLLCEDRIVYPVDHSLLCTDVDPDTVGQFTGLTDRNGKKIFEGDIIQDGNELYVVSWVTFDASFSKQVIVTDSVCGFEHMDINNCKISDVIGNVLENPELLREE